MPFFCLLVSQNEHLVGISVYFMDIMGDFAYIVQFQNGGCMEWANNISGNFAKF
jgi:hypothetical protein